MIRHRTGPETQARRRLPSASVLGRRRPNRSLRCRCPVHRPRRQRRPRWRALPPNRQQRDRSSHPPGRPCPRPPPHPTRTAPSRHFSHRSASRRRRGGPPGATGIRGRLPDCRWRSTASPIPLVRQRAVGPRALCITFSAGPPEPANPLRPGQFRRAGVRTRPRRRVGSAMTALRQGGAQPGHQQPSYRLGRQQVSLPQRDARPPLDHDRPHPHPGRSIPHSAVRRRCLPPPGHPHCPTHRNPLHRNAPHRTSPHRTAPHRTSPHRNPPRRNPLNRSPSPRR